MIADIGQPVATEKPEAAPPVIIYLRQAASFFELIHLETPSPIAVPICTHGPSVPSGIPHKNVNKAEKGRTKIVEIHLKLTIPRIATIDEGIPPPLQLCDFESIKLDKSPITAAPNISTGNQMGFCLKKV